MTSSAGNVIFSRNFGLCEEILLNRLTKQLRWEEPCFVVRLFGIRAILLICGIFALIACDENKPSGNVHAGKDSKDCSESNNPNCFATGSSPAPLSGEYDYESYGDGDVVTFKWEQTLAWFLQSESHRYGFDRDPFSNLEDYVDRGKDVYMSVQKGEEAVVKVFVDPESKNEYHLHKINEKKEILQKDIVVGIDVCRDEGCVREHSLPVGIYAVYYGDIDKNRYLHIFEYAKKTNEIYFVQLGDEYGNSCEIGSENGCYTRDRVQENYNRIMAQVVTEGRIKEIEPTLIGLDVIGPKNTLVVDLSDDIKDSSILQRTYDKILTSENFGYGKELADYKRAKENLDSAKVKLDRGELDVATYNAVVTTHNSAVDSYESAIERTMKKHVVLGINEMRIKWVFVFDGGKISLKNYSALIRACQVDEFACESGRVAMMLNSKCGDTEVPIELDAISSSKNEFIAQISGIVLKKGCEYTIYADVYPFVPDDPLSAQITRCMSKSKTDNTVVGGMVWGSHLNGAASHNTIVHEIGHSFGLTDLYKDPADPSNALEQYGQFTFNESNIMASSIPSGERLRFRPLFVVETGTSDKISLGNGWFATENQWDCVRSASKCYKR